MKKFLIVLFAVFVMSGMTGVASAEFSPNVSGEALFTFNGNSLQGISTDVATWEDNLVSLRFGYATALQDSDSEDYTTVGFAVSVPKIVEKLGGNWLNVKLNPTLGLVGMFDLNGDSAAQVGITLNAIRIDF